MTVRVRDAHPRPSLSRSCGRLVIYGNQSTLWVYEDSMQEGLLSEQAGGGWKSNAAPAKYIRWNYGCDPPFDFDLSGVRR